MIWQPVDCHAHSTFSDGALSIAQVVERAASLGVQPSVADHISHDVSKTIGSIEQVRVYLDELDRYPVLRGGEFCYHDTLWRELPDDLVRRVAERPREAARRPGELRRVDAGDDDRVHVGPGRDACRPNLAMSAARTQ